LRQVPDTQEVFLYPDSGVSIIVEVLQSVAAQDPQAIANLHFESLAHDNDAEESELLETTLVPTGDGHRTPPPIVVYGTQKAHKFNREQADLVRILIAVYRVADRNIDLVMTMNVPIQTSADDQAGTHGQTVAPTNGVAIATELGAVDEDAWKAARETFEVAARSLRIVDFGLFA